MSVLGSANDTVSNGSGPQNSTFQPGTPWWGVVLVSVVTSITILANALLILVFLLESRVRTVFNYYVFNLALADFMVGAGGMTFYSILTAYDYWPLGYKQCTAWIYLDYMGVYESLFSLLMISSDRLWAVTWPISYRQHHTSFKCILTITSSWIFLHIVIVPSLTVFRLDDALNQDPLLCYWDVHLQPWYASSFYVTIFSGWLPIVCTLFCYLCTTWKVGRHRKKPSGQRGKDNTSEGRFWRKERQTFVLMTLLIVALVVLWGPYLICQAMMFYSDFDDAMWFTVTYWLAYSTSGLNPFLFNIASPEMRAGVQSVLRLRSRRTGNVGGSASKVQRETAGTSSRSTNNTGSLITGLAGTGKVLSRTPD